MSLHKRCHSGVFIDFVSKFQSGFYYLEPPVKRNSSEHCFKYCYDKYEK